MSTLQINLPDELQNWIESRARADGYADAEEFVGLLLREGKARRDMGVVELTDEEMLGGRTEAEVAALLNEGLASGRMQMTVDLWAEMLGEADAKLKEKGVNSQLRENFLAKQRVEDAVSA